MNNSGKTVKIYGSVVNPAEKAFSMFKKPVFNQKIEGKTRTIVNVKSLMGKDTPIDISWLKQASTKYNISPDINDYVCVPVPIITSDIPNRNSQGFSLEKLTEFDIKHGCLRYKTFIGKPTHIEHQSSDCTKAKGVNIDSAIKASSKYKVAKIIILSAFDRTKDSDLANKILSGEVNSYSMGATTTYFKCSICGGYIGPAVSRTCTCTGTDYNNLSSYGRIIRGKLHYLLAEEPVFVEASLVYDPADYTAVSSPLQTTQR